MFLRKESLHVDNGEVHFTLVSQSGHLVQPVTMGVGAARELAEELLLTIHLHERQEREAEVLDRILEDIDAAPGLPERIAATATAMSHDDLGDFMCGERFDGLS